MRTVRPMPALRRGVVVGAAALAVLGSGMTGFAATPAGDPGLTPVTGTPHLTNASLNSPVQQVRQLVQCGSTMYAVGAISKIASGSTRYARAGAFSFGAVAPYAVTSWNPKVNGAVNTIAFANGNCSHAYIGGKFTRVGSTKAKNIAEVSTSTGAVIAGFRHKAAGKVDTIASTGGHLLVGGAFTGINGSTAAPYFTSLDPSTGKDDGYLRLNVSGHYVFSDDANQHSVVNPTKIFHQQISPDGSRDLIEGDFTSIGGQPRRQVAMVDLGAHSATIDDWSAAEFNANCKVDQPMYIQDGAWSPDGQTVYFATTGDKPANGPGFALSSERAGLCDSASAFPTTSGPVTHLWINYTGCDSLYSAAAGPDTAYFAGHERWMSNPDGCDTAGPGSVDAPGMAGLSATDGSLAYNPTRDRGLGADDLLLTDAGLWVASDNYGGSNICGGVANLAGICFLPDA